MRCMRCIDGLELQWISNPESASHCTFESLLAGMSRDGAVPHRPCRA